jgi:hypothetical protein
MSKFALATLGLAGVSLLACSTKSASEYGTNEMYADVTAVASGTGTTAVSATFRTAPTSLTFLQLTTDDKLEAKQGGVVKTMAESSLLGAVGYRASFDADAAGTVFTVSLTRTKDGGAPNTQLTMPEPFVVTPLANAQVGYSRATDAITLDWQSQPSTDPMKLRITGTCMETYSATITSGSSQFTVPAATLHKRPPVNEEQVPDECDATATITREHGGGLDPGYKGGQAKAVHERTVTFKTKP